MFGKKTLGRCRIHHCLTLQNGRTINHPKEESCLSVSPNYLLFKEYGTPYIYGISKMCLMGVARLSKGSGKQKCTHFQHCFSCSFKWFFKFFRDYFRVSELLKPRNECLFCLQALVFFGMMCVNNKFDVSLVVILFLFFCITFYASRDRITYFICYALN